MKQEENILLIYGENATGKTQKFKEIMSKDKDKNHTFVSINEVNEDGSDFKWIFLNKANMLNNRIRKFLEGIYIEQNIKSKTSKLPSEKDLEKFRMYCGRDLIAFIGLLSQESDDLLFMPIESILGDDEKYLSIWKDAKNQPRIDLIINHVLQQKIKDEIAPWSNWEPNLFNITYTELDPLTSDETKSSIYSIAMSYTPIQLKKNLAALKNERLNYNKEAIFKNSIFQTIKTKFMDEYLKLMHEVDLLKQHYSANQMDDILGFIETLISNNRNFENIKIERHNSYAYQILNDSKLSRGQIAIITLLKRISGEKYE